MLENANAIGMSIIKIRVLGHAGKGIFQDFPPNQNLLLLIDAQVWRLVVIETCAGDHYFSSLLPSPSELLI